MRATKLGRLHVNICHVDEIEIKCALLHVKYCKHCAAGVLSLTCKSLQGAKLSSDDMNNIILETRDCQIVSDR